MPLRGDLQSPRLIWTKGLLFLLLGLLASGLLLWEAPSLRITGLLVVSIWAFCRFYYFTFYVIEHYVDGEFRYAGLAAFVRYMFGRE